MARVRREQSVEFTCIGMCEDSPCWLVEGRFEANGSFMPVDADEDGSSAGCPECGERGEPTDPDVVLADW